MKRNILFVALISIAIFFIGCNKKRKIEGNQNVIFHSVSVGSNFDKIISLGDFNVYISQGNKKSIKIEAESNLIPYIDLDIEDYELEIDVEEKYKLKENYPINIYVTSPDITGIRLAGSGNITCDSLNTDNIDIELLGSGNTDVTLYTNSADALISGSGNMNLYGNTTTSYLYISGSGNINSKNLIQEKCYAKISGSGNIFTNVSNYLSAKITGSGNIQYLGSPKVDVKITGSGDVNSIY